MWQLSWTVVTNPQIYMCNYSHVQEKPLLLWRDQAFKIYQHFIFKWMIWLVRCLKYSCCHSILVQLGDTNLLALSENQPRMEKFFMTKGNVLSPNLCGFLWVLLKSSLDSNFAFQLEFFYERVKCNFVLTSSL